MADLGLSEITTNLISGVEEEIAASRSLSTSYALGVGRRAMSASNRSLYHFSLNNPPRLQEESRGILRLNSREVECVVLSRRSDGLDISTFDDLGDEVSSATLVITKSDVLDVLLSRLRSIHGEDRYNQSLIQELLSTDDTDLGDTDVGDTDDVYVAAPEDLTNDQKEAVRVSLSRRTTFLWGPPGTGKTVTLSAIAWELFRNNKRVLILSHTNHAVDGVLEALCKRIVGRARVTLPEATILRLGTIARRSLATSFGEQISLDSLIALRARKAAERVEGVRKELDVIERGIASLAIKRQAAERLSHLKEEMLSLQEAYTKARLTEGALKTVLRMLHIRYGEPTDGTSIRDLERTIKNLTSDILSSAEQLDGQTSDEVTEEFDDLSFRKSQLREAIADLEGTQGANTEVPIENARVVACTASQAILRIQSLKGFDAVLIDEGSMVPLPAMVLLAGLARERAVVAGDFRQLPPISISQSAAARQWFARDIFEAAGIVEKVESGKDDKRLVSLTSHFRGHETLCQLINERFYGGRLAARSSQPPPWKGVEAPFGLSESSIVLVDTSGLSPRGHISNSSKVNILHALLVRKIVGMLRDAGMVEHPGDLGVIAPYRPQVSLIEDLLQESGLENVTVGTAHRFQGGERRSVVLDLTESPPHSIGSFLGPRSLRDVGAKLLNVSLSRAQHKLVVVANLRYLNENLGSEMILRGVLDDIQRLGRVVDARELVDEGLVPSANDDRPKERPAVPFQRFDQDSFIAGLVSDIGEARRSISIGTRSVTPRSAHVLSTVLRPVIARGVTCVAHTPVHDAANEGVNVLQGAGIAITLGPIDIIQCVVIDDDILWFGDIAPLGSVEATEGTMVRVVGRSAVAEFRRAHELLRVEQPVVEVVANL
jgi:superfamily I DNA and/or RNA helicase